LRHRTRELAVALTEVVENAQKLEKLIGASDGTHDEAGMARRLADELRPAMAAARDAADRLEHLVDDELWTVPKYREMLFVK
jgi:glutamine synthetase